MQHICHHLQYSYIRRCQALPLPVKEAALLVFRCNRNFVFKDSPAVRRARLLPRVECGNLQVKQLAPKPGLRAWGAR